MQQRDPIARLVLVASLMLALFAAFGGSPAAPAQAEAQQVIIIATPTLGIAPAVEVQAVAPVVTTPVVEQAPVADAGATVSNEGARPVEHQLSDAPKPIVLDPPSAVQGPPVLLQANDGPSFAAVVEGEGSKPARAWKP